MQPNGTSKLRTILKTFVALLAGALIPAMIVAVVYTLAVAVHPDAGQSFSFGEFLSAAPIVLLFAFAFTAAHVFILGLPVLLIGLKLRAIRWWSCLLVGFVIGYLPTAFTDNWATPLAYAGMGAIGMIGTLTFWLIWHFWVERPSGARPSLPAAPVGDSML